MEAGLLTSTSVFSRHEPGIDERHHPEPKKACGYRVLMGRAEPKEPKEPGTWLGKKKNSENAGGGEGAARLGQDF